MTTIPHRGAGANPTLVRVYARTPDGAPLIIDVPDGETTCPYVAQAREAGGVRIRICALNDAGRVVDRVVVR